MRKPNRFLALMAGAVLLAFLPLDDAAAQPIDVQIWSVEFHITRMDFTYRDAVAEHQAGQCADFEDSLSDLRFYTSDRFINVLEQQGLIKIARADLRRALEHANQLLAQIAALGPCEPKSAISVSAGGGGAVADVPQDTSGTTVFSPGDEGPTAESKERLNGQSAFFLLQAPVGSNLRGSVGFNGIWADGSSGGETDGDAANTYLAPNSVNGSTGVGFPGGQVASTNKEVRILDGTAGVSGTVANFGGSGLTELAGDIVVGSAGNILPPPGGANVVAFVGARVRDYTSSFNSFTEALLFIDDPISAQQNFDIDATFVGGEVGAGLIYRLPVPDNAIHISIFGNAAFGETSTDATAIGKYHAGPLGPASPEFDFAQRLDFDESNFSAIYGVKASAGMSTGKVTFEAYVAFEQWTGAPAFSQVFTPDQQPIRLIEDDINTTTFGVRGASILAPCRMRG